jgi:hypothetical protein
MTILIKDLSNAMHNCALCYTRLRYLEMFDLELGKNTKTKKE